MFIFFKDSTRLGHVDAGNRTVGIAPFPITFNDNANATPEFIYFSHHDEPSSTSQITYAVKGFTPESQSTTLFVNRTIGDTDNVSFERGTSFIMAQEIKV